MESNLDYGIPSPSLIVKSKQGVDSKESMAQEYTRNTCPLSATVNKNGLMRRETVDSRPGYQSYYITPKIMHMSPNTKCIHSVAKLIPYVCCDCNYNRVNVEPRLKKVSKESSLLEELRRRNDEIVVLRLSITQMDHELKKMRRQSGEDENAFSANRRKTNTHQFIEYRNEGQTEAYERRLKEARAEIEEEKRKNLMLREELENNKRMFREASQEYEEIKKYLVNQEGRRENKSDKIRENMQHKAIQKEQKQIEKVKRYNQELCQELKRIKEQKKYKQKNYQKEIEDKQTQIIFIKKQLCEKKVKTLKGEEKTKISQLAYLKAEIEKLKITNEQLRRGDQDNQKIHDTYKEMLKIKDKSIEEMSSRIGQFDYLLKQSKSTIEQLRQREEIYFKELNQFKQNEQLLKNELEQTQVTLRKFQEQNSLKQQTIDSMIIEFNQRIKQMQIDRKKFAVFCENQYIKLQQQSNQQIQHLRIQLQSKQNNLNSNRNSSKTYKTKQLQQNIFNLEQALLEKDQIIYNLTTKVDIAQRYYIEAQDKISKLNEKLQQKIEQIEWMSQHIQDIQISKRQAQQQICNLVLKNESISKEQQYLQIERDELLKNNKNNAISPTLHINGLSPILSRLQNRESQKTKIGSQSNLYQLSDRSNLSPRQQDFLVRQKSLLQIQSGKSFIEEYSKLSLESAINPNFIQIDENALIYISQLLNIKPEQGVLLKNIIKFLQDQRQNKQQSAFNYKNCYLAILQIFAVDFSSLAETHALLLDQIRKFKQNMQILLEQTKNLEEDRQQQKLIQREVAENQLTILYQNKIYAMEELIHSLNDSIVKNTLISWKE